MKGKKLPWKLVSFIFELPVFILLMPRGLHNILLSALLFLLLFMFLRIFEKKEPEKSHGTIQYPLLSTAAGTVLAFLFYQRWSYSGGIRKITGFIGFSPQQSLLFLSILLAFLSVFGIDHIFSIIFRKYPKTLAVDIRNKYSSALLNFYFFLAALITITLNSECSPLYAFNSWSDPNFMITVGKGVLKGYVPYRDLYEQKGPLLLFLHTIGAAISFNSFTGIWIIEIIFCTLFLFLSYKISRLFFSDRNILVLPVLAALIFSRWAFQTGDTAEEFCLPLLTYAILFSLKMIQQQQMLSRKKFFLLGLTSGCVFWIKYSMTGFYIGLALFFLICSLASKQFLCLLKRCFWIPAGFFSISLPILIYFIGNRSLSYLFTAYFNNNIFSYAKSDSLFFQNLRSGFDYLRMGNMLSVVMFISGISWFIYRRQWKTVAFLISVFSTLFIFVFFGARRYIYYGFIFSIFTFFGFFWPMTLLDYFERRQNRFKKFNSLFLSWSILAGAVILCCSSRNMSSLEKQKKDLMQYQIKNVIEQSGIDDPTVLEYQTPATGVNTVAGLIPHTRFFCSFNLDLDEMEYEQNKCFEEGCSAFVIIQGRETYDYEEYEQYTYLGSFEGNIFDTKRPYYFHLYRRKGFGT